MLSYCFKCRKNKKSNNLKTQKLQGQKTEEECFYKNVQCVVVENQNLSNSKKLVYC